jgi:transposase
MKKAVKQAVGIDVSQNELVVQLGRMYEDWSLDLYSNKAFANTPKGHELLMQWVNKNTIGELVIRYVLEATGVYHEQLAYFLDGQGCQLSIILPNKISNYFRTLEVKTVTDKTASEAIARFGLERKLDNWRPASTVYRKLRQLVREKDQLVASRTVAKNQLHAEKAEAFPNASTVKRTKAQIVFLEKQEKEIKEEIAEILKQDKLVNSKVNLLKSIPGIGILTAVTVLAETNGFDLIRNKKQLTSYAGLDIKEKQSGTSIKGKPSISKRGNKYLRKSLHMPALSAIRHDERFKAIFARLVSNHGIKMKAAVAVQRKLLEMTYTIFKTQEPYDKKYLQKSQEATIAAP